MHRNLSICLIWGVTDNRQSYPSTTMPLSTTLPTYHAFPPHYTPPFHTWRKMDLWKDGDIIFPQLRVVHLCVRACVCVCVCVCAQACTLHIWCLSPIWKKRNKWLLPSVWCHCWCVWQVLDKGLVICLLLWEARCDKVEVVPYSILEPRLLSSRASGFISISLATSH